MLVENVFVRLGSVIVVMLMFSDASRMVLVSVASVRLLVVGEGVDCICIVCIVTGKW